jgi:hypothetical protein
MQFLLWLIRFLALRSLGEGGIVVTVLALSRIWDN